MIQVIRKPSHYSILPTNARFAYAQNVAAAGDMLPRGLFDNRLQAYSASRVFLIFETGAMLGLEPMAALQGIDVVEGRATIAPRLMIGLLKSAGYAVKITETGAIETGDYAVNVRAWDPDNENDDEEASFSLRAAARADLITLIRNADTGEYEVRARSEKDAKLPWEKYTEDMVLWRAVSRLGRRGFGHILMGIAYTPDELMAVVGEDGVRDTQLENVREAELIAELLRIDDKADMREFYHARQADNTWTPRLSAEFDAHLMTLTRDSGGRRPGAPGNTGLPELDGAPHDVTPADDVPSGTDHVPSEPEDVPAPAEVDESGAHEGDLVHPEAQPGGERELVPVTVVDEVLAGQYGPEAARAAAELHKRAEDAAAARRRPPFDASAMFLTGDER